MRRLVVLGLVAVAAVAAPAGGGAVGAPILRLTIIHLVSGCHAWQLGEKTLGPAAKVTVKRGTRLELRPNCPMDFEFRQASGPKLALGAARTYAGTTRTIAFPKAGVYKLAAANVQSSEQQGLQTLGPDNTLSLTVVVR